MKSAVGSFKCPPLSFLWALILFSCLWARDYPKPMPDDLYYIGAGLHLAEGGDFSNPLIVRQEYPSHYFFVYPPLYSYALAGWLKITGISTRAVTAFAMLMYLLTAISAIAILRKHNAPPFLEWLVPLGVCTSLHATGMRSEAVSIGLTMAGFALVECNGKNIAANVFGFLLMFLGASAAPRLAFFAGTLLVFSAGKLWMQSDDSRKKQVVLVPAMAAMVSAVVIFLAMIDFRLAEFWRTFHAHAELVKGRKLELFLNFLNENRYLNGSQAPIVWALGAILWFAWPRRKSDSVWVGLAIMAGFILEALAGGLAGGALWYAAFALLLFSSAAIKNSPELAPKMAVALAFLFLLANVEIIVIECQRLRGKITSRHGEQEKMALDLHSTPEHPVLIDSWTARYAYNYRIPPGFLDIQAAAHFPKAHVIQQWRPNDIYVVGPENVKLLNDFTFLTQPLKMRSLFGLPNRRIFNEPCLVFVIPADDCLPRGNGP